MSVKQLRVTWQVPWVGSPLAPYEYQGLKFRGSCCSLGPPGKVFFPGSGLTQTPSLTKGEGNQGHWGEAGAFALVSQMVGLRLQGGERQGGPAPTACPLVPGPHLASSHWPPAPPLFGSGRGTPTEAEFSSSFCNKTLPASQNGFQDALSLPSPGGARGRGLSRE